MLAPLGQRAELRQRSVARSPSLSASNTAFVISSTNNGMPSVRSTMSRLIRAGSGLLPVTPSIGESLPEIGHVTGDPGYYLCRLEQFVRENGIELRYSDEIAPARGMAEKGKITLLPEQTPPETFATLVHEVAHSEMHFGERRSETTKRIRETEAESVAYVVCSAIGLETGTAAQDYVGLYGGDSKLLLESLHHIQQAANRILTAIAPENSGTPA